VKYTVIECEQRSLDWFKARLGRLTGSRAADMLATRKDRQEAAARRNYRMELVAERLTNVCAEEDVFVSREMQRGADFEAQAFAAYEAACGQVVQRAGFVQCDEIMAGSSVDGYIGDFRGVLELKVPKSTTHLEYILGDRIPEEYLPQMLNHLWITGAEWCDFGSWDGRMPEHLQLFTRRLHRSGVEKELATYDAAARLFLAEVDDRLLFLDAFSTGVAA
jgi:YqaJ-like viral recombinase domain